MKITDLLLMRHELILIAIVLSLLVMKIAWGKNESSKSFMLLINIMLVINFLAGLTWNSVGELFGGMYVTDHTLSMEKNLLNLGTLIISLQAYDWLKNHKDSAEFYLILLSTLLGMFFMISSGHLLMFYIGLELATLPLSALASFNKHDKKSAEAGLKMILMSGFSTAILLFGISLLYGTSGSLLFSNLAVTVTGNSLQILAFIFLLSGFAFKISIVPFHLWTADVYEGAPISITSYLSVISKSAVILIFVTILYKVFSQVSDIWGTILLVTSVLTMTVGNLFALRQENMKRFLAFSSIAQAGYILLGILGSSVMGMTSVVYFILIYIFSNLAAFGVISSISAATGKENLGEIRGLYRTNPKLSILLLLAMFSLAGVPPTAGFFGKFFLLTAAAGQGHFVLVTIAALNMIISLYYYLRVVKTIFIDTAESPLPAIQSSFYSNVSFIICGAGIIATGFIGDIYEFFHSLSFGL